MPRLGGPNDVGSRKNDSSGNSKSVRQKPLVNRIRSLIATAKLPRCNARNLVLGLLFVFVFRNIVSQDYQQKIRTVETEEQLKHRGYSQEQIDRIHRDPDLARANPEQEVRTTPRRDETLAMKRDIHFLLNEVTDLRKRVQYLQRHGAQGEDGTDVSDGAAGTDRIWDDVDDARRAIDILHMEKRRKKEREMGLGQGGLASWLRDGDAASIRRRSARTDGGRKNRTDHNNNGGTHSIGRR